MYLSVIQTQYPPTSEFIKQWPLASEFSEFEYSPEIHHFWRIRVLAKMAFFWKCARLADIRRPGLLGLARLADICQPGLLGLARLANICQPGLLGLASQVLQVLRKFG
jgi:hypothetical protein